MLLETAALYASFFRYCPRGEIVPRPPLLLPLLATLALVATLALSGCGNSVSATAMVTIIDLKCTIIEQSYQESPAGKRKLGDKRSYEGECHEIDDWNEVKKKRGMNLKGNAEIHLAFTGADGKSHSGIIKVDGQDAQFYDLKAGDSVKVKYDPKKCGHIWFG